MNFNNIKYRLASFMRGRYGLDALYRALMATMLFFLVMNLFFPSMVFYLLSVTAGFVAMFRMFSKNHAARTSENQRYLAFKNRLSKSLLQTRNRFRDRKTHRYINCPSCRQSLRLARKPGMNHVKCPMCKNEFDVNIR